MDKKQENTALKIENSGETNPAVKEPAVKEPAFKEPAGKEPTGRSASAKNCLRGICRRSDAGLRDSYDELLEGESRIGVCKGGVKRCTAVWWKIFLMMGIMFLLSGVVCISYGYIFASRVNGTYGATYKHGRMVGSVYRDLEQYKQDLEIVKLVGLILFCVGGLTVAVALMIPSFLYRHFEVDHARNAESAVTRDQDTLDTFNNSKNETSSLIDDSKKIHHAHSSVPANQGLPEVVPSSQQDTPLGRPNKAFR